MRNLINVVDFSKEELQELMDTAIDIIENPNEYSEACKGKILATLFFEPSTRTRLSFESAMLRLGGEVLGFSEESSSSASKGESYADTAKIVSAYADIIATRSPKEGSAFVMAKNATVPVINAGDGGHFHPTQTLTDLLTIYREKGSLDNLTIGFCGDLKYGRTVHSLISSLTRYSNIKLVLISPDELKIPSHVRYGEIIKNDMSYIEMKSLEEALPSLDVLYMTRIQRERFPDQDEYEVLKNSYILDAEKMKLAKKDMIIMHPLPRVNEISVKVDDDPRALYFKQAKNGIYIRMALILKLLEESSKNVKENRIPSDALINVYKCTNPKCICQTEQELDHIFRIVDKKENIARCIYCDKRSEIKF